MRMYDDQTILRPYTHFIFVLVPPQLPSRSTLFPYTTLFRSYGGPFGRRIAMLAMSGTNSVHSLRCPAVTRKPTTTPFRSQTRCSLLPQPPRARPRAWSAGSRRRTAPRVRRVFPPRPGGGLQRPDRGAVHAPERPVDPAPALHLGEQRLEQTIPGAVVGPARMALVQRLP